VVARVGCDEAGKNGEGRPDVGAEVDGVGSQSFASRFIGDALELAGAGEVDCDREKQRREGPDGEFEREMFAEGNAADGLGENPDAGAEHENGFDAGGEALDLAMAIGVDGVGGAVGDLDGEECDGGGDEVDAGVRGLREHSE